MDSDLPVEPVERVNLAGLPRLARKLQRAVEVGRGVRLSGRELDLLAAVGIYRMLAQKEAEEVEADAIRRLGRERD